MQDSFLARYLDKNEKFCYTYDVLNRVTARTVKNATTDMFLSRETFTYDAAGNITGDSDDSCFEYDMYNKLVKYDCKNVSYDLDGNMLNNGFLSCMYDSANRLLYAGGNAYTYNAEDVRIKNVQYGVEEQYTYHTNCKLSKMLMRTVGTTVTKYVYGLGLISEETNNTVKVYHFDYRGSTVAVTDSTGEITDTFEYDTYGLLTSRTGTSDIIFCYNGRDGVVTDKNGLFYMRARYYSPDMRRFVNADILHGKISDSTSLNRYSYVNGNPVSFVDPFGLSAENRWDKDDIKHSWEELGFVYDASMQDLRRFEAGLPPISYEQWLKTGYGYSEDPYWDALLGNYDAFYVADYDYIESGGLPIVAHAYLLLKDKEGKWIKTEFSGSNKSNAKIRFHSISPETIVSTLSVPLENIAYMEEKQHVEWVLGFIPIAVKVYDVNYLHVGGVQFVPIKGDFSKSIEMARNESRGNYGGYNLIENNCLHYVRDVLRAGTASSVNVENVIESSVCIVPNEFYDQLYVASK